MKRDEEKAIKLKSQYTCDLKKIIEERKKNNHHD